jgi:hypothetical protein
MIMSKKLHYKISGSCNPVMAFRVAICAQVARMFRVQIRRSLHDEGDFRVVLIVIPVCGDFCLLTLAVKPVTPVKFLNVLEITKNGHSKYDYRPI